MFCHHVYSETGHDICPTCGNPTRETNWKLQEEQRKEWIDSGKAVAQGWWSI